MIRKNYNEMILRRVEMSFDKLMPICAIVAWVSSVAIYFSTIPTRFAAIDGLSGVNFMLLSIFRRRVRVEFKVLFTIINPVVIGILSFMDGGFSSAGITLIMIGNVIAVLFLSRKKSILVSLLSIMIFVFLWYWSSRVDHSGAFDEKTAIWVIQFVTFVLYLVIIHTIVYSIRKYLIENIEDLDVSIEQIYDLAYFDQLTGLPNQHRFKDVLAKKMRKKDYTGYLVFMSVMNLDIINSLFGEKMGDEVLMEIARIFNELKLESELIGRISGNEFALWFEEADDSHFNKRLNSLLERFHNQYSVPNMTKKIDFNIGYAQYISGGSFEDCYQKTSLALTFAKAHKDLKRIAYDHTLDIMIRYDETMKELLEEAIENDAFQLFYQAKVNTFTNQVVGVEALARWNPEVLGSVTPKKFIPIIEKMNISIEFGELIVDKALKDYDILCHKYGENLKLSINISPMHFVSAGFDSYIKSRLEKYQIEPDKVILEITEEVMIVDIESVSSVIYRLQEIGVKISLDDFGSGYSSLNYLSLFDIDELKIDKSFVDQIFHNEKIEIMLKTIIELGKEYNLNIVAEGVETKQQYLKLLILGCNEIQGYYFSKPEPLEKPIRSEVAK